MLFFSFFISFSSFFFFFFNDTATTEIYTLSLHDALPICGGRRARPLRRARARDAAQPGPRARAARRRRSEEHTSELQSLAYLVCRLLLEKKKKKEQLYSVDKRHKKQLRRDSVDDNNVTSD